MREVDTKGNPSPNWVSLGGFGGYIVVGFDHSIDNSGDYDLGILGNSFSGSSEPGIVWVMQDENGNGLPDDTWYELAECLVEYGYLKKSLDYNVLSITAMGKEALSQRLVVKLPVEGGNSSVQPVSGTSSTGGSGTVSSVSAMPAKKSPAFGVAALTVDKKKSEAKKQKAA